jgi:hypothetical protein
VIAALPGAGLAEATFAPDGGEVGACANELNEMSVAIVTTMVGLSFVLNQAEKARRRRLFGDIRDTSCAPLGEHAACSLKE